MDIGFVGLHDGRAVRRLARAGMRVLGFDAGGLGAAPAPPAVAGGTVNAAMEHGVAAPVLSLALMLAFAAAGAPDANDGGVATTRESNR